MPEVVSANTKSGLVEIPQIVIGTHRKNEQQIHAAVNEQIETLGKTAIDTAPCYKTEEAIGNLIKQIPRENVFLTTKFEPWEARQDRWSETQLKNSLRKTGLDYVDLYLMHAPISPDLNDMFDGSKWVKARESTAEAWQDITKLRDDGLVRYVGISNFSQNDYEHLVLDTQLVPDVNQLCLRAALENKDNNRANGVHTQIYSPFSLFNSDAMHNEPMLAELVEKYQRTVGQIILRLCFDNDCSVVVGATYNHPENLKVFDFELAKEDRAMFNDIIMPIDFSKQTGNLPVWTEAIKQRVEENVKNDPIWSFG